MIKEKFIKILADETNAPLIGLLMSIALLMLVLLFIDIKRAIAVIVTLVIVIIINIVVYKLGFVINKIAKKHINNG